MQIAQAYGGFLWGDLHVACQGLKTEERHADDVLAGLFRGKSEQTVVACAHRFQLGGVGAQQLHPCQRERCGGCSVVGNAACDAELLCCSVHQADGRQQEEK